MPACVTRSQTHQEIRQRCLVLQDSFPHQPEGLDSLLMGKWIKPVKVHVTPIRGFVWMQSGIPSPSQKSCLCHLSNPFVVSVPALRSHPYYLTLPPRLHRLPGYVLFLFLFQGLLKGLYLSPEAVLGAAGTKNRTNCLAV